MINMATIKWNRIFILLLLFSFLNNLQVMCIETKADSLNKLLKKYMGAEKIEILNELSTAYDTISYIKSLDYAMQSLELTKKIKGKEDIAISLDRVGRIHLLFFSNYDKSLDLFFESLKIREEIGDKKTISKSYNNIGVVYMYLGKDDKALEYLQKAWDMSEGVEDKVFMTKSANYLGNIYTKLNNYDKSLEYYQKALNISVEDKKVLAVILNNIGIVYWYLEDYNKTLEYYLNAIKVFEEIRDKRNISNTSRNIGEVYIKLQDYNNSLLYLNKGLKIAKKIDSKHLIKDCYVTLSELYFAKADYKKAYEYHTLYSEIKDSIFSEETGKNIAEIEVKFETEKKDKEILQQKKQRNIYFIAFVIAVVAIILIMVQYHKKNSAYKFLVTKNLDVLSKEKELKNCKEKIHSCSQNIVDDNEKGKILNKMTKLLDTGKIFKKDDLTLNKLAKRLFTNRTYLSNIIRDEFGKYFPDFINEYRVKEVMFMLSDPEKSKKYSIETIAKEAGFKTTSSFNSAFKKFTGITPSVFKNSVNNQ